MQVCLYIIRHNSYIEFCKTWPNSKITVKFQLKKHEFRLRNRTRKKVFKATLHTDISYCWLKKKKWNHFLTMISCQKRSLIFHPGKGIDPYYQVCRVLKSLPKGCIFRPCLSAEVLEIPLRFRKGMKERIHSIFFLFVTEMKRANIPTYFCQTGS